jgi:ABC-type lipoprotein release transport system permease subunit
MALGAGQGNVSRLVMSQALRLALFGLTLGVTLSPALTRFLRGALFGVASTDALTFAGVQPFCASWRWPPATSQLDGPPGSIP